MSDAFTRAGKRFDLLVLPGGHHTSIFGPHWFRTVGAAEPPDGRPGGTRLRRPMMSPG